MLDKLGDRRDRQDRRSRCRSRTAAPKVAPKSALRVIACPPLGREMPLGSGGRTQTSQPCGRVARNFCENRSGAPRTFRHDEALSARLRRSAHIVCLVFPGVSVCTQCFACSPEGWLWSNEGDVRLPAQRLDTCSVTCCATSAVAGIEAVSFGSPRAAITQFRFRATQSSGVCVALVPCDSKPCRWS